MRGFALGILVALAWVELGRRVRNRPPETIVGLGFRMAEEFKRHGGSDAFR